MQQQNNTDEWQEIRDIHRQYRFFYQIFGGVILVFFGILVGAVLFTNDPSYKTNLYTDFISIVVTVFVIDLLARRRASQQELLRLRTDLVFKMGSRVNHEAVRAVEQLRRLGCLEDGTLEAAILWEADLQRAPLAEANLRKANLNAANLQEADFVSTDMYQVKLVKANLQNSTLLFANLSEADLESANLVRANLYTANLCGANLKGTNLSEAILNRVRVDANTVFDEHTILPNGKRFSTKLGIGQLEEFIGKE
jgi:Pentapeptide repeats (8 copies)